MRILAQSPCYLPDQWSGGETMLHDYLKFLVDIGYHVDVIADRPTHQLWEGVHIHPRPMAEKLYPKADLVISHLGTIGIALNNCRKYNKPLIYIVHNNHPCSYARQLESIKVLYNSEWCKADLNYPGLNMIGRPIINYDRFKDITPDGEYITMVNININKGGKILKEVAERLPQFKFIAVLGGYGEQQLEQPSNVTILPNGTDVAQVFEQSKLVLMPSKYESWGRVAAEATVSGIPVMYADTPGLREVMGEAGYMIEDRDNADEWVKMIPKYMSGKLFYKALKAKTRQRAKELLEQAKNDKVKFSIFVDKLIQDAKVHKSKGIKVI